MKVRWAVCAAGLAFAAGGCADGMKWDWGASKNKGGLFGRPGGTETWTIECVVFEEEVAERRPLADRLADALRGVRELRSSLVSVSHEERRSTVYYGQYELTYDRQTDGVVLSPELRGDLQFIRSLSVSSSGLREGEAQYPFFAARPVVKAAPVEGPPEWDLANAEGVYTLQVGWTHNTTTFHERQKAAVEWVRDLRSRGYEAYYYHSPEKPISLVTVGTFDESAVSTADPQNPRYSDDVRALQAKEEFAFNLENGGKVLQRMPDGTRQAAPSFLVRIPRSRTGPTDP